MSSEHREIFRRKGVCPNPFILLEVLSGGDVAICCPGRLKDGYKFVGNVLEESLQEIWNGPGLREFRRLMYCGATAATCESFCPQLTALREGRVPPWYSAYADAALCREMEEEATSLSSPFRAVSISCDGACNLYCIMCRPERQSRPTDLERRVSALVYREVLERIGEIRFLELTGNGDPFFSRDTMHFLERLAAKEVGHLTLRFITNGQLLDEAAWEKVAALGGAGVRVSVSIDAATAGTYEAIRRGGSWERLVRNMEMLARKRREGALEHLQVTFVVMRRNIGEIVPFTELARSWHCDRVEFQRILYDVAGTENVFVPEEPRSLEMLAAVLESPSLHGRGDFLDISSLVQYRGYRGTPVRMCRYRLQLLKGSLKTALRRLARPLLAWRGASKGKAGRERERC